VKMIAGDYSQAELGTRMDKPKLIGDVIETWQKHASERLTIVFGSSVRHSMHLCERFKKWGVISEHIDGKMDTDERDWKVRKFKAQEIQVLCNCMIGTFGFDVPPCSCAVLVRPTKSLILYRQMVGRVLRPYPGKENALVIDHSGAVFHFGFPDDDIPWQLAKTINVSKEVAEQREHKPAIITCEYCGNVYESERRCPHCGELSPPPKPRAVKMQPGELKEVQRRRANQEASADEKQKHWDHCLGVAIGKKLKVGAAAHMYKQRFGVWPNNRIQRLPKSLEWRMDAKEFYRTHVKKETSALTDSLLS